MRVKIIANPVSGTGRGARLSKAVGRELARRGYGVDLTLTTCEGDARRFASEVGGYDRVVFVGGDGTMSEVLNGLPLEKAPPLGAVPCGTGNAFAKELELPWTLNSLADLIDAGVTTEWDVGYSPTNERRFGMFAGAGFQAEVIREFQAHRRGPVLISDYLRWGIEVALHRPVPRVSVEVDGRLVARDASWVDVFNVSHYGGPLRIACHASPSDGYLDVMVLSGRKFRRIFALLFWAYASFMLRRPFRPRGIDFYRGKRVRLLSDEPAAAHMDGEYCGELPLELELLPERVRLIAPRAIVAGVPIGTRAVEASSRAWAMARLAVARGLAQYRR